MCLQSRIGSGHHQGQPRSRRAMWLVLVAVSCILGLSAPAWGLILVDCTGVNKSAYPTITAGLNAAPIAGAAIVITGPCTENVSISGFYNLNLGAAVGKTVVLTGSLTVSDSANVYLYGMQVTNAKGTGISISASHGVTMENCTSSGNASDGLGVATMADVTLLGTSSFDNNKEYGINASLQGMVNLGYGSGPIDVSDNTKAGVWLTEHSTLNGFGEITIAGNGVGATTNPASVSGYGIEIYGASVAQFGDCTGSNAIKNNASGGVSVQENSQFSIWECGLGYASMLQANGPVGVTVALSGEVTLDTVQITGHTGPAVAVLSNSALFAVGGSLFSQNGSPTAANGAGVAVSGGSHALLESSEISSTIGPAILADLGSTVEFRKMTFSGNGGGIIQCDASSYMWTDMAGSRQSGLACTVPSAPVIPEPQPLHFAKPDTAALRNRQAAYRKAVSGAAHANVK